MSDVADVKDAIPRPGWRSRILARRKVVQARRLMVLGLERCLALRTTDRGDAIPPGKASPHFHPPLLKDLL